MLIGAIKGGKYDYSKLAKKKKLTEKELNALKNFINKGGSDAKKVKEMFNENPLIEDAEGISLDAAQIAKGKKYLYNLGFTPKGKEKSNSPFRNRENNIVKNLEDIVLIGFFDTGNRNFSFNVPVFEAYGGGSSMEYYVSGGKINIIG